MLAEQRREYIYKLLMEKGSITVSELSLLCRIGEETIRRDLNKMAAAGRIEKIHGGACIRESMHRVLPVSTRRGLNMDAKQRIALKCCDLVEEGDTIFLDGSTTAQAIAEVLIPFSNLIVITNSLDVAQILAAGESIKVIGIGGTMRNTTKTFVGHSTVTDIGAFYADKCIICCDGADRSCGITDAHEQEAEVRKTMLSHSKTRILAADRSKFDKTSFSRICTWDLPDIIVTDIEPDEKWKAFFQEKSIRCEI